MLHPMQAVNGVNPMTGGDALGMMSPSFDAALNRLGSSVLSNDWMAQAMMNEAAFNQRLMVILMGLMKGSGGANAALSSLGAPGGIGAGSNSGGGASGGPSSAGGSSAGGSFGPLSAEDKKWLTGDTQGMDPKLAGALAQIGQRLGKKVDIRSGFRSRQEQEVLYQKYLNGTGNLAAKPGSSNHESGNAADVYIDGVALNSHPEGQKVAAELGVTFPVPGEPWHAQVA